MRNVITTREAVRQLIEQAVGLTHPEGPREKDPAVINEPAPSEEVPITPVDAQIDQEIATSAPVDDEDYVPTNVTELGRAALALSRQVPPEKVEGFYKDVKKLVQATKESKKKDDEAPKDKPKESEETDVDKIQEMKIRSAVRRILSEAGPGEGEGGYEGARGTKKKHAREISLDDVAKAAGLAGASGARQLINKAAQKAKFLVDMDEDDRNEIIINAAGEYIDHLVQLDKDARKNPALADQEGMTADDADFMRQHPEYIQELDGFREFLRKYWLRAMREAGVSDADAPDVATMKMPVSDDESEAPAKPKLSKAEKEKRSVAKADAAATKKTKLGGFR